MVAMLVAAVLAGPVLAQETAATVPNKFVEVAGNRIACRGIGRGTPMVLHHPDAAARHLGVMEQ